MSKIYPDNHFTFAKRPQSHDVRNALTLLNKKPSLPELRKAFNEAADYGLEYLRFTAIDLVEKRLGRAELYEKYKLAAELHSQQGDKNGADIFDVGLSALGVKYHISSGSIENIPKNGPLIVGANHPYGVVDGLSLASLLHKARPDFKLVGSDLFLSAPEVARWIIPIDTTGTKAAEIKNRQSIMTGYKHLSNGGCIGIFPSGKVSRPSNWKGYVEDYNWNEYVSRLFSYASGKHQNHTRYLPVYFDGHNGAAYQMAYLIKSTILRRALLISETLNKKDLDIAVNIGTSLVISDIPDISSKSLASYLRAKTYALRQNDAKSCWSTLKNQTKLHPSAPLPPPSSSAG